MIWRLGWIFAFVLLAASCDEYSTLPPATGEQKEKITVLATVYPLADIARQIGGPYVTVEWVAESGQAFPGDEAPPPVATRAELVDFVISAGENWAARGFDDPFRAQRIIRLNVLQSVADAKATEGLAWLDPAVARELAQEMARRFAVRRPRHTHYFNERAKQFIEELDILTRNYRMVLDTSPPREALVISTEWDRLLAHFEMQPLRPVHTTPSALTSAQARQLAKAARQRHITSIFVTSDTPPAVIREVQDATDLTVLTLDPLGTSADTGRRTYLQLLKYNLDQLHQGASRP